MFESVHLLYTTCIHVILELYVRVLFERLLLTEIALEEHRIKKSLSLRTMVTRKGLERDSRAFKEDNSFLRHHYATMKKLCRASPLTIANDETRMRLGLCGLSLFSR